MTKLISIVIPTHNEAGNIVALYNRIVKVFMSLGDKYEFELIFSDDSFDDTPEIIKQLISFDHRVNLIRLSRSFGQSVAVVAALEKCSGAAAVMMDADLQDPPEAIPLLLRKWEEGSEVVMVERPSEKRSLLYSFGAYIFYRILDKFSNFNIPINVGEFRLVDRKVIEVMNKLKEKTRFLRGLTLWPGFSSSSIQIVRQGRLSGDTNYNFFRSLTVAVDGIVSFSMAPLRIMFFLGAIMFGLAIVGIVYALVLRIVTSNWVSGWTLIFVSIMLFGGTQFLFLGIIGEYIGRIFLEVLDRPLYVIDYEIGRISVVPPLD